MGRPLTGSLRSYQGLWWVSVPEAPRLALAVATSRFVAEDDARSWLAQAVAAVRQGSSAARPRTVPHQDAHLRRSPPHVPTRPRSSPTSRRSPDAWMNAAYEDLRRGGPERAERVRRIVEAYLVPWFAPRTTTIADVTYLMAHEWLLRLVGRDRPNGTGKSPGVAVARCAVTIADGELSLAEAAEAAGVSLPTVRRRWRAGQLPGAYRDPPGHIRVPARCGRRDHHQAKAPVGLSQGYVADALWVLRRVLAFARANGLFPPGFDPTEGLDAPTRRQGRRPQRAPRRPAPAAHPGRMRPHRLPPPRRSTRSRSGCSGSWACASPRPSGSSSAT